MKFLSFQILESSSSQLIDKNHRLRSWITTVCASGLIHSAIKSKLNTRSFLPDADMSRLTRRRLDSSCRNNNNNRMGILSPFIIILYLVLRVSDPIRTGQIQSRTSEPNCDTTRYDTIQCMAPLPTVRSSRVQFGQSISQSVRPCQS